MNIVTKTAGYFLAFLAAPALFASCRDLLGPEQNGSIVISFDSPDSPFTRAGVPDTDDFLLNVSSQDGSTVYKGRFADSPEILEVAPGSYTISAVSCEFSEPSYESPQYGDTRVVLVKSGQSVSVELQCVQLNCGINLDVDRSFSSAYPYGTLYLKGSDGTLLYDYSETRTAYFNPGVISLLLSDGASTGTLFSRTLAAQQILSLNVSAASEESSAGISIQLDTTRTWLREDFRLGGGGGGPQDAFSVSEAKNHAGETGVWVYGYVVGSFNSSGSNPAFEPPFKKNSNIAIAGRSTASDKSSCLSVELKAGPIRDALNLVDDPARLGKAVFLKGDIVDAYYGIPGLKNVSEYMWK